MTTRNSPPGDSSDREIDGGRQTLARPADCLAQGAGATPSRPCASQPFLPAGSPAELTITRTLAAPIQLVWKAWTDPKHLAQWWGPHEFTNPVCEIDVRPGGRIRIDMRGPDSTVYPMVGTCQEVIEPHRLAFTSAPLDAQGQPLFEVLNTVTLAEEGGRTTLTLHARVVTSTAAAAPYLAGMEAGWTQSLQRLETHVTKA